MSFKPYDPASILIRDCLEEASQTFVAGNLVYINTSGYLEECGTDPATIAGIAAEDANNSTQGANKVSYYKIRPGDLFYAKSNTTTAQTHVGGTYGVVNSSSNWQVDISETSNTRVNIEAIDPRSAVGTSGGKYIVSFKSANIQGHL